MILPRILSQTLFLTCKTPTGQAEKVLQLYFKREPPLLVIFKDDGFLFS